MVACFCSIGGWCDSGSGIWKHVHSFREVKCLKGYCKTLWMYIQILRLSAWAVQQISCCDCGFPIKTNPDREAATRGVLSQGAPATLLKKRLWHRCFPVNFAKFLRTPFSQNTSGRLLLQIESYG